MNNPPRLLTLEEVQQAPPSAMIYLEYRFPMQYHKSGTRRADFTRYLMHPAYMAAHYGQWFRCWTSKPGPEDLKENEWREWK